MYLIKINNKNTRKRYEICSKLTIKTPEWHHLRRSDVFIVKFEHISHIFLMILLLTLNKQMLAETFSFYFHCKQKKAYDFPMNLGEWKEKTGPK